MGNKFEKEQTRVEKVKNKIYECKFKLEILSGGPIESLDSKYVVFNLYRSKLKCKLPDSKSLEFNVATDITVVKHKSEKLKIKLRVRMSGADCIWKIEAQNMKLFMDWKEALMLSKRPCWLLSPICQLCSRKFCPLHRCHHCRYCGKAVCGRCSMFKSKIEIYGYKHPQRICGPCTRRLVIENQILIKNSRLIRSNTETSSVIYFPESLVGTVVKRSSSAVYSNLVDYQK